MDSLDALELVTSVEKAFGVSIPNADEAQRAFGTLGSLVASADPRRDYGDPPKTLGITAWEVNSNRQSQGIHSERGEVQQAFRK